MVALLVAAATQAVVTPANTSSAAGGPGAWRADEFMNAARTGQTTTLLDGPACSGSSPPAWCGRVLVVGGKGLPRPGRQTGETLASAELYDPGSRTWVLTVSMSTARFGHTATPLGNGRVLVAGGLDRNNQLLASAEVYDPSTGRWAPTAAPMTTARANHTATLFGDRRVLVAGGLSPSGGGTSASSSSEVFDADTGGFGALAPMGAQRSSHSAVLIGGASCAGTPKPRLCGSVLVVGGSGGQVAQSTAEVFEPAHGAQGAWRPTGPPAAPVTVGHTTTSLGDGRVLVAGGIDPAQPSRSYGASASQLYDRSTETWRPTGSMRTGRAFHVAASLDATTCASTARPGWCGRVVVAGGRPGAGSLNPDEQPPASATAEVFDPSADEGRGAWVASFAPLSARLGAGATPLPDGTVLVAGGHGGDPSLPFASAERFDPGATTAPPSVLGLEPAGGPVSGGTVVAVSGAALGAATAVTFGEVAVACPSPACALTSSTSLRVAAPAHAAGTVSLRVTTPRGQSFPLSRARFSYAVPAADWSPAGVLDQPRDAHTATMLPDGTVLVAGGCCGADGVAHRSTARFLPLARDAATGRTGTWVAAGPLRAGVLDHTATLLPGARVLVAGGSSSDQRDGSGAVAVTQLYEGGTWRDGPSLAGARAGHTATPITGDRVLVAGGRGAAGAPVASAEVFAGGVWQETGSMATARTGHTATPLPDGRVLIVGGRGPDGPLKAVEIYDPSGNAGRGEWLAVPPMAVARAGHTATLLAGGQVLVAGGRDGVGRPLASAEVFSGGSWHAVPAMPDPRAGHTATVLNGACHALCGQVVVVGGAGGGTTVANTVRYDHTGGRWETVAARPTATAGQTATALPDGRVLVAGGRAREETLSGAADVLAPRPLPAVPAVTGISPTTGPPGGGTRLSITGIGFSGVTAVQLGTEELREIVVHSDTRITVVTPPARFLGPASVTVTAARRSPTTAAAVFTFTAPGVWAPTGALVPTAPDCGPDPPPTCVARLLHTATSLDGPRCWGSAPAPWCGKVLVVGGSVDIQEGLRQPTDRCPGDRCVRRLPRTAQLYDPDDPAAGTWSPTGALAVGRSEHSATVLNGPRCRSSVPPDWCGMVLVAGGQDHAGLGLAGAELYDPTRGLFRSTLPMAQGRLAHTATLLDGPGCLGQSPPAWCGKVLVAGGTPNVSSRPPLATAELYDPASGTWSSAGTTLEARAMHTATPLGNGDVLLAGGVGQAAKCGNDVSPVATAVCVEVLVHTERYRPGAGPAGTWEQAAPMAADRFGHSATLLDGPACRTGGPPPSCGRVLVAGGITLGDNDTRFLHGAEVFDPASDIWVPAGSLALSRGGHSATLLPNGRVLVAGRSSPIFPLGPLPDSAAETYDPATGRWSPTEPMGQARGLHTATLLDGPDCRAPAPPSYCGTLLVAGGVGENGLDAVPSAERYTPVPEVTAVTPAAGPSVGGTPVVLTGTGFAGVTSAHVGDLPATRFSVDSPTRMTVVTPAQPAGTVEVRVTNGAGPSDTSHETAARFTYVASRPPGAVTDLVATPLSETSVLLSFSAVGTDGGLPPPASTYVVKQGNAEIGDDEGFAAAATLCEEVCRFDPASPGDPLNLTVTGLSPGTTYHFSVRATDAAGALGDLSNNAAATTFGTPPACPALPEPGPAQLRYPPGYSMVGLPAGTRVGADSPLYGWLDQGAGGNYSRQGGSDPVAGGRSYWAWFACPRLVDLPGAGNTSARLPLGGYHASMVGNPSAVGTVGVAGHDFAARWDGGLNGGAGGYRLSGYREQQTLALGEGTWVFAYDDTVIEIRRQ